jgi:formylglycine-generating enzyme required for sulfatase activity
VAGFCLDLTEVTAEAYAACVAQGRCTAAGLSEPNRQGRERCNAGVKGRGQHPINCVGWAQAGAYCKAQGKRLPAEAEWELAARGGGAKANRFPWGDAEPVGQLCWRRAEQGTCPVGSHPQGDSALGFKDLAGNVEEWVEDRYGSVQPDRVTRGGGFPQDDAGLLCAGCRSWSGPEEQDDRIGFRCASAATPP